ncbi:MAG: tRNA-specific 2-thiouridylase, partial [Parcubacteria group bacterium Athens0714_24]
GGIPYYIVAKDAKKNLLIVADKADEEKFYKKEVKIRDVNWINTKVPKPDKIYKARIRYRQPLQSCRLMQIISADQRRFKSAKIRVVFTKPQRAVTSGQSLVLYDGKEMLGGGIIK